jgi:hypothetical protein
MITVGLITKEETLGDFIYDDFDCLSEAIEAAQLVLQRHAHERATIGEDQVFGWAHGFVIYDDDQIIFSN